MLTSIRTVLLGVLVAAPLQAQGGAQGPPSVSVDEVWIQSAELRLSVTARDLLDTRARETLEQGGTSTISYIIELYRHRRGWFDSLIHTVQLDFRVSYDPFEKTYRLLSEDIRLKSEDFDEIVTQCTRLGDLSLGTLTDLSVDMQATYYINVRSKYQPVATESLDDLRKWLGEPGSSSPPDEAPRQKKEGLGSRLARVLMSAAGLGEHEFTGQSGRFRPVELPRK